MGLSVTTFSDWKGCDNDKRFRNGADGRRGTFGWPQYLETLAAGLHKIVIVSNDGRASTNFTIKNRIAPTPTPTPGPTPTPDPKPPVPPTGDSSSLMWWLFLMVISAAIAGTLMYSQKRKTE